MSTDNKNIAGSGESIVNLVTFEIYSSTDLYIPNKVFVFPPAMKHFPGATQEIPIIIYKGVVK